MKNCNKLLSLILAAVLLLAACACGQVPANNGNAGVPGNENAAAPGNEAAPDSGDDPVKPAEKPIEYTEVLDPGYLAGDILEEKKPEEKAPVLHFAPLYEDLDKPVVTPFDQPEKKYAPASEISIQATEPEAPAEHAQPGRKSPLPRSSA